MTVREIQGHLLELYGLEVSPDLISTVTDAVLETVAEWQDRLPIPMKPPVCNGMIAPRDSWMMPPPCNEMIPPGAPRLLA